MLEIYASGRCGPGMGFGHSGSPDGRREPDVLLNARILIVEDEAMVAMLLEDQLLELGCEVVGPASSIEEAMASLACVPIHAAVLDVNIAGQMIFPVADVLAGRDIPFVFATAYGAQGVDPRHAQRLVLAKPFNARTLEHALRGALVGRSI